MDLAGYTTYAVQGRKDSLRFFCAFNGASSHKSEKKKVFEGKKRGQSCVPDEDVIVKAFGLERSSEKRCDQEMEAAAVVKRLGQQFCKAGTGVTIGVVVPGKAQVDALSIGNTMKKWPIGRNEWVLVEDKVPGKFCQFTNQSGVCQKDFCELETFAHFVYHVTKGQMVVCGLQGTCKKNNFILVSPTVHSASQSYGPCDMGQDGIARFFKNHKCNDACRDWLIPEKLERHLDEEGRPPALSTPIDITRDRPAFHLGGFDWSRLGGSPGIDFSPWSTVGPFGSPLSPAGSGFFPAPPYASPPMLGSSTFDLYCHRMIGSPPPAYDVVPSAPYEGDVVSEETDVVKTREDKLYRSDLPPPYEVACRAFNT